VPLPHLLSGRAALPLLRSAAFVACLRGKRGRPLPPPDVEADPKPGMIAKMQGPLPVKNHSFAGSLRPPSVVQFVPSRDASLYSPLQGRASRLFSCPLPGPNGPSPPRPDRPIFCIIPDGTSIPSSASPGRFGPARCGVPGFLMYATSSLMLPIRNSRALIGPGLCAIHPPRRPLCL
jgi:hypothetical protein